VWAEKNSFAERKKSAHTLKLCAFKILFWNFFLTVAGFLMIYFWYKKSGFHVWHIFLLWGLCPSG